MGGGGEGVGGLAGRVLPGNSERGRGVTLASLFGRQEWRLIRAGENCNFFPRGKRASQFGDSFQRLNLADSFCGLIWQVYSAGKFGKFIQRVFDKVKEKQ